VNRLLRPQSRRSFRQRHFEFDLRELLGGLANLAQEGEPARVGVDVIEEVLRDDFGEAGVMDSTALSSHSNALSASPRKAQT